MSSADWAGRLVTNESTLAIRTVAELQAEEAASPDPKWLIDRILMTGDYGVYAGKPKVGKTWLASDLAVSLATKTDFLEHYPVEMASVLFFAGEGGRRRVLRRLEAIARSRGGDLGDLQGLRIGLHAPVVNDQHVREALTKELMRHPADLIIGEPFYLMGRGVGRGQLNEIGAVLGVCQELAQEAGAALLIGDHWNKGGEGIGAQRITGAGMHEWARVLLNGLVEDTRTDVSTRSTSVDVRWDVSGEMADFGFKIRREVWPEDSSDPASRLEYRCTFLGEHDPSTETTLSENAMRILGELRKRHASEERPAKASEVCAVVNVESRRRSEAWDELHAAGKVDSVGRGGAGKTFEVWLTDED